VASIGTDAAAVLPRSMEIEFPAAAAGAGGDKLFENLARDLDGQVSKAVLGQTMTADSGASLAPAAIPNEVRHDIAQADARAVSIMLNRDLVRPFVDRNLGVQPADPRLAIELAAPADLTARLTAAEGLIGRGLRVRAADLRAALQLSAPAPDEDAVGAARPPEAPALNRAAAAAPAAARTARQRGTAAAANVTTSNADARANRRLKAGDSGMAGACPNRTNLDDNTPRNGFYRTAETVTTAGTWPPSNPTGFNRAGVLIVARPGSGGVQQIGLSIGEDGVWRRRYPAGQWWTWQRMTRIRGTVSMASGEATGALFEAGSNGIDVRPLGRFRTAARPGPDRA
jgi:hypothetical protein